MGVDFLSVAGHKLYGPKGVGALSIREGIELEPLLHGAAHEAGRRAGTENILQIVGLGSACNLAQTSIDEPSIAELRDHLWRSLEASFGDRVVLNGHPTQRLPNTLNVGFRGCAGGEVLAAMPNVAASTGSACHAGSVRISPVLAAMNVPRDSALGAVRFSLGRDTTRDEIDCVVESIQRVAKLPAAAN
jgi:cysteine desulfurase